VEATTHTQGGGGICLPDKEKEVLQPGSVSVQDVNPDTNSGKVHVCVCICTFRRPLLLKRLLEALEKQQTENAFTFSVVVADND
jgi:hypothetical protein